MANPPDNDVLLLILLATLLARTSMMIHTFVSFSIAHFAVSASSGSPGA